MEDTEVPAALIQVRLSQLINEKILIELNFLGLCFYTPNELADKQEFERVSHPLTLKEMMVESEKQKAKLAEIEQKREASIIENIVKLKKWESELRAKIEKKETEGNFS